MTYVLDDTAIQELLARLEALGDPAVWRSVAGHAAKRAGKVAEEAVGEYPPEHHEALPKIYARSYMRGGQPTGHAYQSAFVSVAQQRAVFAAISEGEVPYRRTGRLGASITSEYEEKPGEIIITVGTNVEYASLVLKRGEQAPYHEGWWDPIEDRVETALPDITAEFADSVRVGLSAHLAI